MSLPTPPEMLVHVSDLLASTSEMTDAEFGLYLRLLFKEWMDGPIPDDIAKVARISRGQSRKSLRSAWNDAIRPRFRQSDAGKLINPRLEATRNLALSAIESRRARSRTAATARWEKVANAKNSVLGAMLEQCSGIAAVMPEDMLGDAALSIVKDTSSLRSDVPAKRISPSVAAVEFDPDDERLVDAVLAAEAEGNKSKTLAVGKVLRLRSELRSLLDDLGHDAWKHGCEVAARKPAGVNYARAVMKKYHPGEEFSGAQNPLFQDEPRHRTRAEILRSEAESARV